MAEESILQAIPKKSVIIILITVVVYDLLFAVLGFAMGKVGDISSKMSEQSLANWWVVGILLSLYTLTIPWRRQKKIISLANQYHMTSRQIWGVLIVFCFAPFISPLVYGLVLLFWGLSFIRFCYFFALSVVTTLAWSVHNLRKNS